MEGDEHWRQFEIDELHITQVPSPKRYAMDEHELQVKVLLIKEQSLHNPLIVEQALHDAFDPTPTLIDPSAHPLTQRLLINVKPGKQLVHWVKLKQFPQLGTLHCKKQLVESKLS